MWAKRGIVSPQIRRMGDIGLTLQQLYNSQKARIRKQNKEIRAEKDPAMKTIRIQMRDLSRELLRDIEEELLIEESK